MTMVGKLQREEVLTVAGRSWSKVSAVRRRERTAQRAALSPPEAFVPVIRSLRSDWIHALVFVHFGHRKVRVHNWAAFLARGDVTEV